MQPEEVLRYETLEDYQISEADLNTLQVMGYGGLSAYAIEAFDRQGVSQGTSYVLGGDIVIAQEDVTQLQQTIGDGKSAHYVFPVVLRRGKTIRVYIYDTGFSSVSTGLNLAIDNYNSLNGFNLTFQRTYDRDKADVVIYSRRNMGSTALAFVEFTNVTSKSKAADRADLRGERRIHLNQDLYYTPGRGYDYWEGTITHELGHIIGVAHTDWFDHNSCSNSNGESGMKFNGYGFVQHVPGTPSQRTKGNKKYDSSSIFNRCIPFNTNGELSNRDKIALKEIW